MTLWRRNYMAFILSRLMQCIRSKCGGRYRNYGFHWFWFSSSIEFCWFPVSTDFQFLLVFGFYRLLLDLGFYYFLFLEKKMYKIFSFLSRNHFPPEKPFCRFQKPLSGFYFDPWSKPVSQTKLKHIQVLKIFSMPVGTIIRHATVMEITRIPSLSVEMLITVDVSLDFRRFLIF